MESQDYVDACLTSANSNQLQETGSDILVVVFSTIVMSLTQCFATLGEERFKVCHRCRPFFPRKLFCRCGNLGSTIIISVVQQNTHRLFGVFGSFLSLTEQTDWKGTVLWLYKK